MILIPRNLPPSSHLEAGVGQIREHRSVLRPPPRRAASRPEVPDDGLPTTMPPTKGVRWSLVFLGFLLYILVITSYRLPLGDVSIALALVGLLFLKGGIRFPGWLMFLGALVLWSALVGSFTPYPDLASEGSFWLLKLWLIGLVATNALREPRQIRLFIIFFLGCFALFPLRGAMFNFFLYRHAYFGRAVWIELYQNPNDLAAIALLQLGMVSALLVTERKGWTSLAGKIGMVLVPLLILMTQSRAAFLGLVVFVIVAIAGKRRRLAALLQLGVLVGLLALVAPQGVWERVGGLRNATRISQLRTVDTEGSAHQRFQIWRVAGAIIGDHPITGVGVTAYPYAHESYALRPEFELTARGWRDTHSTYFNVLAEAGAPGLILFLCALLAAILPAERIRRRIGNRLPKTAMQMILLEAGLFAFLTAGIFGSFAYLPFLYLQLALVHGVTLMGRRQLSQIEGPHGQLPRNR